MAMGARRAVVLGTTDLPVERANVQRWGLQVNRPSAAKRLLRFADHLLTLAAIVVMSTLWWLGICWLTGYPPLGWLLSIWEWFH